MKRKMAMPMTMKLPVITGLLLILLFLITLMMMKNILPLE